MEYLAEEATAWRSSRFGQRHTCLHLQNRILPQACLSPDTHAVNAYYVQTSFFFLSHIFFADYNCHMLSAEILEKYTIVYAEQDKIIDGIPPSKVDHC